MPRKVEVDITANTKGAAKGLADVGKASQLLQGILGRLGVVGDGIASVLDKFTGKSIDMTAALGIGTAAVGAAIAVGEKAIDMYVQLGDKVRNYAILTSQSAEQASRQIGAFETLGVSAEVAGAGMFKLAKAVEQTPAKLAELGIQVAKNADGTTNLDGTLLNVVNAYQLTGDAAKRAEIILTAFGKAGAAMIPILETNIGQLKQLEKQVASVYSQEDLDAIRKYKIAQNELKHQTDDLGISLGRTLLPVQLNVTEAINADIYATQKITEARQRSGQSATDAGHATGKLRQHFIDEYYAAQNAKVKLDELAQAQKDAADAALAAAQAEEVLSDAIHKNIDAGFAYRQSLLDLKKAQKDVTDTKGKDKEANLHLAESYVSVADAAVGLAVAHAEEAGQTLTAAQKADIWIAKLKELEKGLAPGSPLRKELDSYIADLHRVPASINTVISASSRAGKHAGGGGIQELAEGGIVTKPTLALVGESGPEAVIPLNGSSGAGGGGNHFHFHDAVYADGPGLDRLVRAIIQRGRFTPGT